MILSIPKAYISMNLTWGYLDCNIEWMSIQWFLLYIEDKTITWKQEKWHIPLIRFLLTLNIVLVCACSAYVVFSAPLTTVVLYHSIFCCVDMQYGFYNLLFSSIGHILLTKPQNKLVAINIHYMLGRR